MSNNNRHRINIPYGRRGGSRYSVHEKSEAKYLRSKEAFRKEFNRRKQERIIFIQKVK